MSGFSGARRGTSSRKGARRASGRPRCEPGEFEGMICSHFASAFDALFKQARSSRTHLVRLRRTFAARLRSKLVLNLAPPVSVPS
eukprot:6175026-Pleurochrysis_carterae.AAC.1